MCDFLSVSILTCQVENRIQDSNSRLDSRLKEALL